MIFYCLMFLLFARSCAFERLWPYTKEGIQRTKNKISRINGNRESHSNGHNYQRWTPLNVIAAGTLDPYAQRHF
jgi:hypothetical protein